MKSRAMAGLGIVAVVVAAFAAAAAPPDSTANSPVRSFASRLQSAGRASSAFDRVGTAFDGTRTTLKGRVALEPPDRVALAFPASGERLALRADGGEWLQPNLEQMMRLGPRACASARTWWAALLGKPIPGLTLKAAGKQRVLAIAVETSDSAWVELDGHGDPRALEFMDGGSRVRFQFSGWRFERPKGAAAFTIAAPKDFAVVDLP
jgi:hypothetical protein